MKKNEITLLTWMATSRDPKFIKHVILALGKKTGKKVSTVYYLYESADGLDEAKRANRLKKLEEIRAAFNTDKGLEGIKLKELSTQLEDPTDHKKIIQSLVQTLSPIRDELQDTYVNITGGTPAMNAVWLLIKSSNFLGADAKFISVQKSTPIVKQVKRFSPDDEWLQAVKNCIDKGEACEITVSRVARSSDDQEIKDIEFDFEETCRDSLWKYKKENSDTFISLSGQKTNTRKEAYEKIQQYSSVAGAPLLVLGERGIGKSTSVKNLVKNKKFVVENCGNIDPKLAESTIFGHMKGSFTGANRDKAGLIEEAENGILFLDEIQDLDRAIQRKLLRVIQEKDHPFRRVGETKDHEAHVEFIFASNRSIDELLTRLDPDFFDRISMFTVMLPSLKECKSDLDEDWASVWKNIRTEKAPETFPLTKEMRAFFSKDENLQGNYRSLQAVAYRIIAWNAWEHPEKLKDILAEAQKMNRAIADTTKKKKHQDFNIADYPEFTQGTWDDAETRFRAKLAKWAQEKYGSWKKAEGPMGKSARTLMDAANAEGK